jgi:signal transduction histidine kinase/ActR/RegA family two-component response regulator
VAGAKDRAGRAEIERAGEAGTTGASSGVLLALAAMRSCATALAALRDGRFLVRNDSWLALCACSDGPEWRRADQADADSPSYSSLEALALGESARIDGDEARRDARWERGAGQTVLDVRLERIGVADDRPIVLVVVADVTERARTERALAREHDALLDRERLRARGERAGGIAHDLNNTLHALGLRASRLRASEGLAPEQMRDVEAIERIVASATVRIRSLQDLARRQDDRPAGSTDLGDAIAHAAEMLGPELEGRSGQGGVVIERRLDPLPAVIGDAPDVQHAVLSLLLNARDAMPDGGRVLVSGKVADGQVEVSFADDGPGIHPDVLPHVFDPFFTTKGTKGSGLGLVVVAAVMRRSGGAIEVANGPRNGAVFTLRFPVASARQEGAIDAVAPLPRAGLPARSVLVVDDDEDNLEAMEAVLAQLGQAVEVTATGAEAVRRVAAGRRYDLVLCDIGLRDTTGWEVAAAIAARAPETAIHLVTGWVDDIGREDPRRRHVAGVIAKPMDVEALRAVLRDPRASAPAAPGPAAPATGPGVRGTVGEQR